MDLRRLVILHSNDIHGDFFAKESHDKVVGGISMLSGYINKVRNEEKDPVLYVISGDMLQGSIIDQEYKGISTILVMNMLEPDVVTLGNHELDYGLTHLMFLERCATFPIVNANLYIRPTESNLFEPYYILEVDGIRILFIGIITEEVIAKSQSEPLIGSFICIEDAAREVEYICNSYKDIDIDLTVLLTHIGFDQDLELAGLLPKEIGVDLIIGGHSHTLMDQPSEVNDILIAQVGTGSEQIGRFDLIINMDTNSVHDFSWQTIPINNEHCPYDPVMDELLNNYQAEIDGKYNTVICRLPRDLEHGRRFRETELGNLFADILHYQLGVDIVMLASGSIRKTHLPRLVTRSTLMEVYPYDEAMISFSINGGMLREMLSHLMRTLYHEGGREFYQWNRDLRVEVLADGTVGEIRMKDEPLDPAADYRMALQEYHYGIIADTFGLSHEDLSDKGRVRVVSTSSQDNIIEYMKKNKIPSSSRDGRISLSTELQDR
ncbi:MAG: bifunctional metallophosphatase/5'-nucleotidase [Clostridiaceae bacterium]|nr:bifunctional metallophosphatase/5'-nucleotidase [Clostridiaceae bacterium]